MASILIQILVGVMVAAIPAGIALALYYDNPAWLWLCVLPALLFFL